MKKIKNLRIIVGLALMLTALFPVAASAQGGYKINAGDILFISVWKEQELSRDVIVRPDGGLSFPLIGEIAAKGKTVEQLRQEMTRKLQRFITEPAITVSIKSLNGSKIFVIGKVNKPGVFPLDQEMDVMQILAMAGGLNPYAAASNIKILRRENGQQKVYAFDYTDVESGKNLAQNRILESGDVVVVP